MVFFVVPLANLSRARLVVGSISTVSRGWVWAHFPEQRLVIEPSLVV